MIDGARTSQANRPSPDITRRFATWRITAAEISAAIPIANRMSTVPVCACGPAQLVAPRTPSWRDDPGLELQAVSLDDRERAREVRLGPEAPGKAAELLGIGVAGQLR